MTPRKQSIPVAVAKPPKLTSTSDMLHNLWSKASSHQLDTLAAMAFMSGEAHFQLSNPDLFQPGGTLHTGKGA